MFTIQYEAISGEHRMQELDNRSRTSLIRHLAHFKRPIVAVYEQASPITKAIRAELAKRPRNTMSRHAQDFVNSHPLPAQKVHQS
jgi:hypothetical protein